MNTKRETESEIQFQTMILVSEGKINQYIWLNDVVEGLNLLKNWFNRISGIAYFVCNIIYMLKIVFPK